MEFDVEELKKALIEKCESEGILYAMVAIDRRTKEVILPDTLQGALKHPEYLVCTCKKVEDKYIVEEITKTFMFYSASSPLSKSLFLQIRIHVSCCFSSSVLN